jgi:threonine aldolase
MLGGSMRQGGVVAAAGVVALRTGIDRLADDHARARYMAVELQRVPGLRVLTPEPVTNFVLVDVAPSQRSAEDVVAYLQTHGIHASARPPTAVRFLTHRQIDDADVAVLVETLAKVLA